jgi:hypothetical protein
MPAVASQFGLAPLRGVELRTVARRLRDMSDRKAAAEFRKQIRAAAAPLVPVVRARIGAIPSKQGSRSRAGGSLRSQMRRATKLYVRTTGPLTGVVIMVDGRKMPSHEGRLPAYMEGTLPRWRHPVFGPTPANPKPAWVQQAPKPYFYDTVRPLGVGARVAVFRAMSRVGEDVTGGRPIIHV